MQQEEDEHSMAESQAAMAVSSGVFGRQAGSLGIVGTALCACVDVWVH